MYSGGGSSELGKTAVHWHSDSGLQDFSTVSVYHSCVGNGNDWSIGLRLSDKANPTPALSVPLPSGTLYHLLDEFNHNHEHAVVQGTTSLRYSSTHRVAKTQDGTWQAIRDKCRRVLLETSPGPKTLRSRQNLLTEIEFEWLRQWFVQGERHARLHPYWHQPIKELLSAWKTLDSLSFSVLSDLKTAQHVTEEMYDVFIQAVEHRHRLRLLWEHRLSDPLYKSLPQDEMPILHHLLKEDPSREQSTPFDLPLLLRNLRDWRRRFVQAKSAKCPRSAASGLTKKEQRRKASNWNKIKSKIANKKTLR